MQFFLSSPNLSPGGQVHENDPIVLMQSFSHPPLFEAHSFISKYENETKVFLYELTKYLYCDNNSSILKIEIYSNNTCRFWKKRKFFNKST